MSKSSKNTTTPTQWNDFEKKLQQYGVITLLGGSLLATVVVGPQILVTLTVLGGIGGYVFFPNELESWFNAHSGLLVGSAIGYLCFASAVPIIGGPIGIVAGAWLGKNIQDAYHKLINTANKVADAVDPIVHPIKTAKKGFNGLWNGIKNTFFGEPSMDEEQDDDLTMDPNEQLFISDPSELAIVPASTSAPQSREISVTNALGGLWNGFKNECLEIWTGQPIDEGDDEDLEANDTGMSVPQLGFPSAPIDPSSAIVIYTPPPVVHQFKQQNRSEQIQPTPVAPAPRSWWQRTFDDVAQAYNNAAKGPRTII